MTSSWREGRRNAIRVYSPTEIIDRAKLWQEAMGLGHWTIEYSVSQMEDAEGRANCKAMPEYRLARVNFDPYRILDLALDRYIVHELTHAFINILADVAQSMAETYGDAFHARMVQIAEESTTEVVQDLLYFALRDKLPPLDEDED